MTEQTKFLLVIILFAICGLSAISAGLSLCMYALQGRYWLITIGLGSIGCGFFVGWFAGWMAGDMISHRGPKEWPEDKE